MIYEAWVVFPFSTSMLIPTLNFENSSELPFWLKLVQGPFAGVVSAEDHAFIMLIQLKHLHLNECGLTRWL